MSVTVEIKFVGIDSFNRPIFISKNKEYYGCLDKLFGYDATEREVLEKVNEKTDIYWFGSKFDCEPMGDPAPYVSIMPNMNIKVLKVIDELTPLADQYKPKQSVYYVNYTNKNDEAGNTIEGISEKNCCESCIDKKMEWFKNIGTKMNLPKDFKEFTAHLESSPEHEEFLLCDECSEIIDVSVIWTKNSQELEHWESKDITLKSIPGPRMAYELKNVIKGCYETNPKRCIQLATKLLRNKKE